MTAAMHEIEEWRIAKQTRHMSSVVRSCICDGEVLLRDASGEIGL
jgi:hypothetical protein